MFFEATDAIEKTMVRVCCFEREEGSMVRLWVVGLIIASAATAAEAVAPSTVTFNKDVLPILQSNCQNCHRPGQVAPMSLLTYQDARPWAKAIKAAVQTRKMPPWNADPGDGHFLNDRSLGQGQFEHWLRRPVTVQAKAQP